ncbi:MAG TPA: MerR family transcriptional regulator [Lachnospiraceae bacterium]|nr:MerR family transcriptional regulator [Lachnospiraceae bacterium]
MKDSYMIGELVKVLGINKETVRYYERIGLLSKPRKDRNGYRIYTKSDLDILRVIHIIVTVQSQSRKHCVFPRCGVSVK